MDALDSVIIDRLRENGRESVAEIARALRLSRTTVQSRLSRLEREGVILGYAVRLADAVEAGWIQAYVMITVRPKQASAVTATLRRMAAVRRLHSVSGGFDLMALATTRTASDMDALIDAIGAIEGVERTTSSILLATKFDR